MRASVLFLFLGSLTLGCGRSPLTIGGAAGSPPGTFDTLTASAGPDQDVSVGDLVVLDGSGSGGPFGAPLGFHWWFISQPGGGVAAELSADPIHPRFTARAAGTYEIGLEVSDGTVSAQSNVEVRAFAPGTGPTNPGPGPTGPTGPTGPPPSGTVPQLTFGVIDAEYSRALDKIILVSGSPNQLHILDGASGADSPVALPVAPTAVSVSPDGLFAAVGHNAHVSYIDLKAAKLLQTYAVDTQVLDVVLSAGYIYAFPLQDQWESIRCVRLSDGALTKSSDVAIYAGTTAKLHPAGKVLYTADNGLSPATLEEFNVANGTPTGGKEYPYWGTYSPCGEVWMSEDGMRIFSRCGSVFRASPEVAAQDMTYNGSLSDLQYVQFVDHSSAAAKVAAIPGVQQYNPGTAQSDAEVHLYAYEYLSLDRVIALPQIGANGAAHPVHGRFVFFSADGKQLFVLEQADASSGLLHDFALAQLTP